MGKAHRKGKHTVKVGMTHKYDTVKLAIMRRVHMQNIRNAFEIKLTFYI